MHCTLTYTWIYRSVDMFCTNKKLNRLKVEMPDFFFYSVSFLYHPEPEVFSSSGFGENSFIQLLTRTCYLLFWKV